MGSTMLPRLTVRSLVLYFCFVFNAGAQQQLPSATWSKAANGLQYRYVELNSGSRLSKKFFAAKIDLTRHKVKALRAQDFGKKTMTAREICSDANALLCINASFFDEKHSPLGLLISSGIAFQKAHLSGDTLTGVFASTRKSYSILGREDAGAELFLEAIQAGPRLVNNAGIVEDINEQVTSRRSGICLAENGVPTFIASDPDSWPATLSEFARVMLMPELGCREGLNLDGGGSSQLFLRSDTGKSINQGEFLVDIRGSDEVPVFLAVSTS